MIVPLTRSLERENPFVATCHDLTRGTSCVRSNLVLVVCKQGFRRSASSHIVLQLVASQRISCACHEHPMRGEIYTRLFLPGFCPRIVVARQMFIGQAEQEKRLAHRCNDTRWYKETNTEHFTTHHHSLTALFVPERNREKKNPSTLWKKSLHLQILCAYSFPPTPVTNTKPLHTVCGRERIHNSQALDTTVYAGISSYEYI